MSNRKIMIAGAVLAFATHPAEADKVFAHSKSLNMSFTALGEPWCAEKVNMRVTAADPAKFDTPDYSTIIQKLGQVLTRECAEAASLSITGVAGDKTVWTGSASRADNWTAQQTTAVASESTPAKAPETAAAPVVAKPQTVTAAPEPDTGKLAQEVADAPQAADPAPADPVAQQAAVTEPAPAAVAEPEKTVAADPAPVVAEVAAAPAIQGMEIAGWKPGNPISISGIAGNMIEIGSQDDGCKIRTLGDIKLDYHPSFKMRGDYNCVDGYVHSGDNKRKTEARLYYEGQKQSFQSVVGYWVSGYNLNSGFPQQIVAIYDQPQQQALYGNRNQMSARMLTWLGEDRELRTHYFATYDLGRGRWAPNQNPVIVVTDNEALKTDPETTGLAQSLAEVYKDFNGYRSTDQFRAVPFVITDKMHDKPTHAYQQVLRESNPDTSFYKAGQAVRQRGTPWMIQVKTDFIAKRQAFEVAEQQRIEAEKRRLAELRARHQASLDQQYKVLSSASNYDRVRFFATLMLEKEQLQRYKINFNSRHAYSANPLTQVINLSHPAQYLHAVQDGTAAIGAPMYMLVKASDGEIEQPYPMVVERSDADTELDDWMLVKTGPEFDFRFDDDGKPVFSITVQDAISCESDKCLGEMDAATMMRTWYDDDEMQFAAVAARQ